MAARVAHSLQRFFIQQIASSQEVNISPVGLRTDHASFLGPANKNWN